MDGRKYEIPQDVHLTCQSNIAYPSHQGDKLVQTMSGRGDIRILSDHVLQRMRATLRSLNTHDDPLTDCFVGYLSHCFVAMETLNVFDINMNVGSLVWKERRVMDVI